MKPQTFAFILPAFFALIASAQMAAAQGGQAIERVMAEKVHPLEVDLAALWFEGQGEGQSKITALEDWADQQLQHILTAFKERTGRTDVPLSAPEYAQDARYHVHLLENIRLVKAAASARDYRAGKARALMTLEKARHLALKEAEDARSTLENPDGFIASLRYRAALDQAYRGLAYGALGEKLDEIEEAEARQFYMRLLQVEMAAADLENARWLKAALMDREWPYPSRYGTQAHEDAWVIVQHAIHDLPWQKAVLDELYRLYEMGEGRGGLIAALQDRIANMTGNKQVYGTQYTCADGRLKPAAMEDPETVNLRRAEIGLSPIEDHPLYDQPC